MDCSLPGASVQVLLQLRTLDWVAIPSPGDLLTQGLSLYLLHWQVDSLPLSHQRSPSSPWKNFIPHCAFCPTVALGLPCTLTSLIFSSFNFLFSVHFVFLEVTVGVLA